MRRFSMVVALILLLAACGGEAETTTTEARVGVAATTAPSPETTVSAAAPTTTTSITQPSVAEPDPDLAEGEPTTTTTTTTLPPTVCPIPVPLADGTLITAAVSGDFDGDGLADQLLTYQNGPDDWRMRVVFADGGGADAAIVDAVDFTPPRPIGGYDIDGDGPEEVFLTVGSGASTAQIGLFDVASCVATRITAGGTPATFGVGGSVGMVSGVSCPGDGSIHRNFASFVSDDTYEGGFEPFALSGSVLTAGLGDGAGFTADEAFAMAVLDCGTLALP